MSKKSPASPEPNAQAVRGKVILGMAMSLDGFIAYRDSDVSRLYPDLEELRKTKVLKESIRTTGAVIMGRRQRRAIAVLTEGQQRRIDLDEVC